MEGKRSNKDFFITLPLNVEFDQGWDGWTADNLL